MKIVDHLLFFVSFILAFLNLTNIIKISWLFVFFPIITPFLYGFFKAMLDDITKKKGGIN